MKKYILTETQVKSVVDTLMTEQNVEQKKLIRFVQRFLIFKYHTDIDINGISERGSITQKLIMKYQKFIGTNPDGIWGKETISKMPEDDKRIWDKLWAMKFYDDH